MTTRKHFVLVAEIISKITDASERKAMAEKNAKSFARGNPRFDKVRFMAACNVPCRCYGCVTMRHPCSKTEPMSFPASV